MPAFEVWRTAFKTLRLSGAVTPAPPPAVGRLYASSGWLPARVWARLALRFAACFSFARRRGEDAEDAAQWAQWAASGGGMPRYFDAKDRAAALDL